MYTTNSTSYLDLKKLAHFQKNSLCLAMTFFILKTCLKQKKKKLYTAKDQFLNLNISLKSVKEF